MKESIADRVASGYRTRDTWNNPGDRIRSFDVYLHGKKIDSVSVQRDGLINHDGYDSGILLRERNAAEHGLPLMEEDEWKALEHQKEDGFGKREHEKAEKRRMIQRRLHKRESCEILKVAKTLLASSLDGMNRQKAVKKVNGVLSRYSMTRIRMVFRVARPGSSRWTS